MANRYEITEAVFTNSAGGARFAAGATVTVKDLAGNNLTVYSAETGAGTIANPTSSDSDGRIEGWVEAPDYDLTISGVGFSTYTQKIRTSPPGVAHVKSYGAVPGIDSTAAIHAALAASPIVVFDRVSTPYLYTNLVIPNETRIIGPTIRKTTLQRVASSTGIGITDNGNATGIQISHMRIDNNSCAGTAMELGFNATALNSQATLEWLRIDKPGDNEYLLRTNADVLHLGKVVLVCSGGTATVTKGWETDGTGYSGGPVKIILPTQQAVRWAADLSEIDLHIEAAGSTWANLAPMVAIVGVRNKIRTRMSMLSSLTLTTLFDIAAGQVSNAIECLLMDSGGTATLTNAVVDNNHSVTIPDPGITAESPFNYQQTARMFMRGVQIITSSGAPEASVTAPVGSIYLRTGGGVNTTLYIKQTGTGNTGWSPVVTQASPQTYTATNVTTDRAYDANATTVDELADVLGTLIADLRTKGLVA